MFLITISVDKKCTFIKIQSHNIGFKYDKAENIFVGVHTNMYLQMFEFKLNINLNKKR